MTKIEQPPKTKPKWVFTFGAGHADGSAGDRNLLGGKGAYLAEMSRLGLPVPPGFTISTEVCAVYYERGENLPDELRPMVNDALDRVGKIAEAKFGDVENPLLVSVRSGSRASMPGMMDTVLNLGLNDQTVEGLARRSGDREFAYDTYRRFIQMYADVVLGLDHELFEEILENFKNLKGLEYDTELSAEDWAELITRYKVVVSELGEPPRKTFTPNSGARSPPCSAPHKSFFFHLLVHSFVLLQYLGYLRSNKFMRLHIHSTALILLIY